MLRRQGRPNAHENRTHSGLLSVNEQTMTESGREGVPANPSNFSDSWGICRELSEVPGPGGQPDGQTTRSTGPHRGTERLQERGTPTLSPRPTQPRCVVCTPPRTSARFGRPPCYQACWERPDDPLPGSRQAWLHQGGWLISTWRTGMRQSERRCYFVGWRVPGQSPRPPIGVCGGQELPGLTPTRAPQVEHCD